MCFLKQVIPLTPFKRGKSLADFYNGLYYSIYIADKKGIELCFPFKRGNRSQTFYNGLYYSI